MIPKSVRQIIPAFYEGPLTKSTIPELQPYLEIAEFFCDSIQGEGVTMGSPAAFLRMKGCTQSCRWCDTKEVWRFGNPFTFEEIFELMERHNLPRKLKDGQYLVLTGGSPLKQQNALILFLESFVFKYGFKPRIQIENECTLMPDSLLVPFIDVWNNSPKLSNSGNALSFRYRPEILEFLSSLPNSWFKFVVRDDNDWYEIKEFYLNPGYIRKEQVILMPQGATRKELCQNREQVIAMAIEYNVRYSTREHIIVWDKRTGI